jgi:LysM repeat protein
LRSGRVLAAASFAAIAFTAHAALASTYSIQPGDSLWTIAAAHHVSVSVLEAKNHLTDSSILQIGIK